MPSTIFKENLQKRAVCLAVDNMPGGGVHISIAKPPPRVLKTRFRKRPRSYIAAILKAR